MPELSESQTYWIREGVRRTKAHVMAGFATIECEVYSGDSEFLGFKHLPIELLRTTKFSIEVDTPDRLRRFERIVQAVADGRQLPPIVVEQIDRGWPIDEVELDYEGAS